MVSTEPSLVNPKPRICGPVLPLSGASNVSIFGFPNMPTLVYMLRRWGTLNIWPMMPSNEPCLLVPNSPCDGSSAWQPLHVNDVGTGPRLTPSDGREPAKKWRPGASPAGSEVLR